MSLWYFTPDDKDKSRLDLIHGVNVFKNVRTKTISCRFGKNLLRKASTKPLFSVLENGVALRTELKRRKSLFKRNPNTCGTMTNHNSKHLKVRPLYAATCRIFNFILGVWKSGQTSFSSLIYYITLFYLIPMIQQWWMLQWFDHFSFSNFNFKKRCQ